MKVTLSSWTVYLQFNALIHWHQLSIEGNKVSVPQIIDMRLYVVLQAKEIYKQTGGKQQVLPLDSIFKKSLPEWRK